MERQAGQGCDVQIARISGEKVLAMLQQIGKKGKTAGGTLADGAKEVHRAVSNNPRLLTIITAQVQGIVDNTLSTQELSIHGESRGVVLTKANSEKLRPIGITNIFMKLADNFVCGESGVILPKDEYGAHKIGGGETTVHVMRTLMETKGDKYAMKLDISNAFNSVSREFTEKVLKEKHPQLLGHFYASYGNGNNVHFESFLYGAIESTRFTIHQTEGLIQGGSTSPLYFAIVFGYILEELRNKHKGDVMINFADDLVIVSRSFDKLVEIFIELEEKLRAANLRVSREKSSIYHAVPNAAVDEEYIRRTNALGLKWTEQLDMLGAVAHSHDAPQVAMDKLIAPYLESIAEFEKFTTWITKDKSNDIQGLSARLYQAYVRGPVQSLTYLLRCMPIEWSALVTDKIDKKLAEAFISIVLTQPREIIDDPERFATFAQNREEILELMETVRFADGASTIFNSFDSETEMLLARIFAKRNNGGAGIPSSRVRSISGFTASAQMAEPDVKRVLSDFNQLNPNEEIKVHGLEYGWHLVAEAEVEAKRLEIFAASKEVNAPLLEDRTAGRGLQSRITDVYDFNKR